jgi:HEAT repeat protein
MSQGSESPALDQAFKALEHYKQGDDPEVLAPIEQAVRKVHGNPAARAALEQRLTAHLGAPFSGAARKFVCRELAVIGSAAAVPALAPLLLDQDLSHMARYALERIPGPEADNALRDALGMAKGDTRVGIIHSVGARRDAGSVSLLARVLTDDPSSAAAAAKALGEIGTPEAARALEAFRGKGTGELRLAIADALLISADRLIASGERGQAVKLLEALTDPSQAPHVRAAASRALSAAMRP